MKVDRTLVIAIGVIIVILLIAGVGYMAGVFGSTTATPTPTPSATAITTPSVQPTNAPTALPTATPSATSTAVPPPETGGLGSYTVNPNPNYVAPTPTPIPTGSIVASSTLDGVETSGVTYAVVNGTGGTMGLTGLPYGDYHVTASLTGFTSQTKSVTVESASTSVSFVFITPTGSIVASSTLDGVATSSVTYAVVNDTGVTVGLTGLPYGNYQVTASLTGYTSMTQTVTLSGASTLVTFAFVTTRIDQEYTYQGTQTFTVPENVTFINVMIIGGGGGGGGGNCGSSSTEFGGCGGGGGSGYANIVNNIPVTPGQQFTVTVGAGGTPGVMWDFYGYFIHNDIFDGGAGGTSSFGSYSAAGGSGGKCGDTSADNGGTSAGGAGGVGFNNGHPGSDGPLMQPYGGGMGGISYYIIYGMGGDGGNNGYPGYTLPDPGPGMPGISGAVIIRNT